MVSRVMLCIYVDYFMQLLAVSTAKDGLSVCVSIAVFRNLDHPQLQNEQIDLEVLDLLSQS